ncbi:MAG: porin [Acinetobacter sp.]|nr:porin [Acinetobacter sp.]
MKIQTTLAAAIALSLATVAQAAPTVYGALDASVNYVPEKNATTANRDVTEITSNNSFIGVKGQEKLNDRLEAVYQIDWTLHADGENTDFSNRTRFIGLKDKQLGTLKVGQQDTPLKLLSSAVDLFNNRLLNTADVHGIMGGENRVSNSIVYESPAIDVGVGKLKVNALTATGEASVDTTSTSTGKVNGRGFGDSISTSVVYTHANDLFLVGAGYDKAMPSRLAGTAFLNASNRATTTPSATTESNLFRLTGRVNIPDSGVSVVGLFQTGEPTSDTHAIDKSTGFLVGATYTVPQAKAWTAKATYSQNTTSFKAATTADFKAEQFIGGVDYAFNKQAKVYGQAGYLTVKQGTAKDKQPVASVGVEYKF